jgi:hypothetical protein
VSSFREFVAECRSHLAEATGRTAWELGTLLTLPLLLLHAYVPLYLKFAVSILGTAGVLLPRLRTRPGFWLAFAMVMCFSTFNQWVAADNHHFLTSYWVLALYCAALAPDPGGALRTHARWLTGLCFLFATVWKATTPDYVDGRQFHLALLTDIRFEAVAVHAGGLARADLRENRDRRKTLRGFDSTHDAVRLISTPRVRRLAGALTWLTLCIEGLIAAAFLLPRRFRLSGLAHPAILVFLVTTYSVAHVIGYGILLAVMGVVQVPPEQARTRALYFGSMALLYVFQISDAFLV